MIDITSIFASAIVISIVGFITTKLWGINLPKLVSDIVVIIILVFPVMGFNPQVSIEETSQFLQNYVITFVNIITPAMIGDAVGSIVSEVTKSFR